jgi:hypothetical protein
MTAKAGTIGGWQIKEDALYSEEAGAIVHYWGAQPISAEIGDLTVAVIFKAGENFGITNEGQLYAFSGQIGGWKLTKTGFVNRDIDGDIFYFGSGKDNNNYVL